jgi:DNA-binding PadR family transcriptional regulator
MKGDRTGGNLDLLILSVLSAGEAHGYEVIRRLRDASDGEFDLPEGTVYPSLHRLDGQGLLASSWDSSGPRRRRVYALTQAGRAQLADATAAWHRLALSVNTVLAARA